MHCVNEQFISHQKGQLLNPVVPRFISHQKGHVLNPVVPRLASKRQLISIQCMCTFFCQYMISYNLNNLKSKVTRV